MKRLSPEADAPVVKQKLGYLSVDIEATGGSYSKDVCFAVGWALGSRADHENDNVRSGKVILDMGKPTYQTWAEFWETKGFEKRCYEEFWSKHLSVLDALQSSGNAKERYAEDAFPHSVNEIFVEAETLFDKVILLTDTIHFDTVWISILLDKAGYPPLNFKRNGKYNGGGIEVDSYKMGVYRVEPKGERPWEKDPLFLKHFVELHDHDPENDAKSILSIMFASMVVAENWENKV